VPAREARVPCPPAETKRKKKLRELPSKNMLRGRQPGAASAAVAALRGQPADAPEPPTADTLRRAAAAKQFIEALAAEQQGRVAAARAARR
jgi:hypothetical protein